MERATSLRDVQKVLTPEPLTPEQLAVFFVETSEARDPHSDRRVEMVERLRGRGSRRKILLAGHRGCGKSTELSKLVADEVTEYLPLVVRVAESATLVNVSAEQLLILIVDRAVAAAEREGLESDDLRAGLERFRDWFKQKTTLTEDFQAHDRQSGGEARVSTGGFLAPFLGLTGFVKADIRQGGKILESLLETDRRELPRLVEHTSDVLLALERALNDREILVVVEDLDKASLERVTALFCKEPGPLVALPVKALFTVPILLEFSALKGSCDPAYEMLTLPMIAVTERSGRPGPGFEVVRDIVLRRAEPSLFEAEALDRAILQTGGVLRQLFEVLTIASLTALQAVKKGVRTTHRVTLGDVDYSLGRERASMLNSLTAVGLPEDGARVEVRQLHERLRDLQERGPSLQRLELDPVARALLQVQALLEYNGERWFRVHPLLQGHV